MEKKSFHRFRKWSSFPCRAACLYGRFLFMMAIWRQKYRLTVPLISRFPWRNYSNKSAIKLSKN